MHSGRTLGWSGRLDWPTPSPAPAAEPARGRHHRTEPAAAWAPVPQQRTGSPEPPPVDPLIDTAEVGGLHKFDLGMVPASITPPKTWKRAAWFAIGSSVAALGGLMFATAMFAGTANTRVDALELPNAPRGEDYPPLPDPYFLTGDPTRPQASHQATPPSSAGSAPQLVMPQPTTAAPEGTDRAPGAAPGAVPGGAPDEGSTAPSEPAPPSGTTTPPTEEAPALLPLTDTEGMKRASERYYSAISAGDLPGAYAMTGGALRDEGYRSFAARYSFATKIEVLHVYVSPASTVHELRLTLPDGSQRTERHQLRYDRLSEGPKIVADERLS
ncbi:hypothetical protein GCM10009854_02660 [Saccharopolyspora halophila]|uniref:Serine/threonine protein kinase n=1 Tax=Saccharopolyspora halophila TaxID=405551 RepID=A0ABP5SHD0_9PSEU